MASNGAAATRQFGKYRLIAHLATGGMAEIYLASQSSLAGFEKLLVIKRILPNLAREGRFVEMFLDEARIAASLNHPNIVQIFDLGRIEGQYFIAMEYLSGESLSTAIKACRRRKAAIPPGLAAGILLQASEGLHVAHTAIGPDGQPLNIVHRDISPQNIFVLYSGGVKVVDFGIAKAALKSSKTSTGTLKGKYAYMSPEQIRGLPIDARSDVFSLGVVLWECLTGRKLFNQDNDLELLTAVTENDAPPPESVNSAVPEVLSQITMRALTRDRDERFRSASELRMALGEYIKATRSEADTMAIGDFATDLFSDRIKKKRQLIEGAQAADKDLAESLFGDISQYASDTDYSIPRSPITDSSSLRSAINPLPPTRPWWQWALVGSLALGLLAVAGAAMFYLLDRQAQGGPDAGAIVVPPPDAGSNAQADLDVVADPTPEAPPAVDGGLVEKPDAEAVAKPDLGKRKKRKRIKRRKRRVVQAGAKNPDKHPKETKGPPGKLRLMTTPWTEIFYKGKRLGQTPLVDVELPSGVVKLRAVNKESGIDKMITVKIEAGGKTVKRFNFF